jgi:predicted DNA-binding transcriptional regulator AlpA
MATPSKAKLTAIPTRSVSKHVGFKEIDIPTLPVTGFIRMNQVIKIFPVNKTTIWRMIKRGDFPKSIRMGGNLTVWRVEDIKAWLDSKASQGA